MKAQYRPCIVFSVDKSDKSDAFNAMSRRQAEMDMKRMGIDFERVLGVYAGVEEYSYIVTRMDKRNVIIGLAKEFDQESILVRDNENNCNLVFLKDNTLQYLGKLKQVSQDEALKHDAYTYSPSLKAYFRCVVD